MTAYFLLYPVFVVLDAVLTILLFIAAPFLHLGHYVLYACWWPFHFLAKFETLYIFFGVAALVGIATGTGLHYGTGFIASFLNIQHRSGDETRRSLTGYRAARRVKQEKDAKSPGLPKVQMHQPRIGGGLKNEYDEWLKQDKAQQSKRGLIPSTILEEDDSSDNGF